jgi:hypothetical protein
MNKPRKNGEEEKKDRVDEGAKLSRYYNLLEVFGGQNVVHLFYSSSIFLHVLWREFM